MTKQDNTCTIFDEKTGIGKIEEMAVINFLAVACIALTLTVGATGQMQLDLCQGSICGEDFSRIVGGVDANQTRWRWQASLALILRNKTNNKLLEEIFFCGGSLIHERWILTAAHCVNWLVEDNPVTQKYRPRLRVVLGDYDQSFRDGLEQELRVGKIIIHPRYDPPTFNNDFALLKIQKPGAVLNNYVQLANLPTRGLRFDNDDCVVTGWGRTSFGGPTPSILQEARLPVVQRQECNRRYNEVGANITINMVCAGLLDVGGVDSCQGDSGGPLMCKSKTKGDDRYFLRGVTSWGLGCALPEFPGVYANVKRAIDWIVRVTRRNGIPIFIW